MSIVLYYSPQSSATLVHWALEELGVPYEKVKLALSQSEQKKPEFLKINPNGKVPAVVIDGTPMFESLAIVLYTAERFGVEKGLWPAADSAARMEAYSWTVWAVVTAGSNIAALRRNTSARSPAEEKNAVQAEAAKQAIVENLSILEAHLASREYMLGASFSLCDVAVGFSAVFLSFLGYDLTAYPNVTAWLGRCTQRPAAQLSMSPG